VILSLLIFTASLGLSLFLDNWGKDRLSGQNSLLDFVHMALLKDAVEGAYDYAVKTDKFSKEYIPYFVTKEDGFSFVTTNPLWGEGDSALVRVRLLKKGDLYQLLYEEASLRKLYLDHFDEPVTYEHSLIIMEAIRSFSIRYYGAESLAKAGLFFAPAEMLDPMDQQALLMESDVYDWYSDYNGNMRRILPRRIEIGLDLGSNDRKELLFNIQTWTIKKPLLFNPDINIEQ
jgi:hypothetical protein